MVKRYQQFVDRKDMFSLTTPLMVVSAISFDSNITAVSILVLLFKHDFLCRFFQVVGFLVCISFDCNGRMIETWYQPRSMFMLCLRKHVCCYTVSQRR